MQRIRGEVQWINKGKIVPTTFVIQNQAGQYCTKKSEWVSGKDAAVLFHQVHHDQALNQLIELNAKNISLRGVVIELALCEKRRPVVVEYGPDPEQADLLGIDAAHVDKVDKVDKVERETEGVISESTEKPSIGFIRPLDVEPKMPKKITAISEISLRNDKQNVG